MLTMRTFAVTRTWRHEGYEDGIEESLILVDGQQIGGVSHCHTNPTDSWEGWGWNDGGQSGKNWMSWGPRGDSYGHPTREAAEQIQVREYAANPDVIDRENEIDRAEKAADDARRIAEANQRAEEARRKRLGTDEPGPTIWTLPAYHALYAPEDEVHAVSAWLDTNDVEDLSAVHDVRVEQRATRRVIVFEAPPAIALFAQGVGREVSGQVTETRVLTLTTDPPPISTPPRPDLHDLLEAHWPSRFPLIDWGFDMACGHCTKAAGARTADKMVSWPCPAVADAIANHPSTQTDVA